MRIYKNILSFIIVLIILIILIIFTDPALDKLSSYTSSLEGLSISQRKNICLAARKIDEFSLKPDEEFSFNKKVGPRTLNNGFLISKVIFENDVVESPGGGICLTSSTLYNAAIRANLEITERTAHTKLVRSVPEGLDATVWYGINDLKFKNNTKKKIRINTHCDHNRLIIEIRGIKTSEPPEITTEKYKLSDRKVGISVYRKSGDKVEKLTDDIYNY